jgi:hypothetical protein
MKRLTCFLAAAPAAALLALSPAAVLAQPAGGYNAAATHWTLKAREHWLYDRLHKAKDDGSINGHEYDRVHDQLDDITHREGDMRDRQDGQLTDNQTQTIEQRLDDVADHIQWLHQNAFERPWS